MYYWSILKYNESFYVTLNILILLICFFFCTMNTQNGTTDFLNEGLHFIFRNPGIIFLLNFLSSLKLKRNNGYVWLKSIISELDLMRTVIASCFLLLLRFVKELVCSVLTGVLSMPMGVLQFLPLYHPLHDIYHIHSEVCVFIILSTYTAVVWIADRNPAGQARSSNGKFWGKSQYR